MCKPFLSLVLCAAFAAAQGPPLPPEKDYHLSEIKLRDVCIVADPATKTYYMVGPAGRGVRLYSSKDLKTWHGPQLIFRAPDDHWGAIPLVSVWAPEMHIYQGKYYLFLTFDTRQKLAEQWRQWRPRVVRGSQVLVSDSPTGPFRPFENKSTLPPDMMTLDGTLWVEDGAPYMVFCHEWVQIVNGTVEAVKLKPDLSATDGEPFRLFFAGSAPWSRQGEEGGHVTDGPYLYKSRSGKLFMIWSSFSETGYTTGLAISDSGKLTGPWRHLAEPLYKHNGGHAMLFKSFDGRLHMVLHSPNGRDAQPRIFEMEDTGEALFVHHEFTGR